MKKTILTLALMTLLFICSSKTLASANITETIDLEDGVTMTVTTRDLTPLEIFEINNQQISNENNLIEVNEMFRGASVPTKEKKISGSASYSYSGGTSGSGRDLFTEYKLYGSTGYKVTIKNTGSNTAKIKAKRTFKTYASTSVAKNKSATVEFSGIKKDTRWWLHASGKEIYVSGKISAK